jgi:hypothetical protein
MGRRLDVVAKFRERPRERVDEGDLATLLQHAARALQDLVRRLELVDAIVGRGRGHLGERLRRAVPVFLETTLEMAQELLGRDRTAEAARAVVDHDRPLRLERFDRLVDVRGGLAEGLRNAVPGDRRLPEEEPVDLGLQGGEPQGYERLDGRPHGHDGS